MNLGLKNKYRSTASLFLNLTLFALPALVQAAPMSIDSITFSDGTNSADKLLDSVTIDGTDFSQFSAPTSATVVDNGAGKVWSVGGTEPTTNEDTLTEVTLSGVVLSDGMINVDPGTEVQFGRTIGLDETVILIEISGDNGTVNNSITIVPVDNTGTAIGDFTLSTAAWGGKLADINLQRDNGGNLNSADFYGLSFSNTSAEWQEGEMVAKFARLSTPGRSSVICGSQE